MRRITVKRSALAGATLGDVTLYCTDAGGDVIIDGITLRKLCALEIGKNRTIDVISEETELCVASEIDGENKILGRYLLPADVKEYVFDLKCKQSLSNLPEFTFEENKKRKTWFSKLKGSTKALIGIFAVIFFVVAFNVIGETYFYGKTVSKKPKEFTIEGMRITLSESFSRNLRDKRFNLVWVSNGCAVTVEHLKYDEFPELVEMTEREYCQNMRAYIGENTTAVKEKDGLTYFTYKVEKEKFHLYAYKTDTAIWVVQFGSPENMYEYWSECYHDWAKSVRFD